MAKGRECSCGNSMYAQTEDDQDRGRWVTYVCSACKATVKVFEDYPPGMQGR